MKKIVCLLLIVLIACAGCYDVEIDKITDKPISDNGMKSPKQNKEHKIAQYPYSRDWWGDWESFSELIQRIERMEREDKILLAKIDDLEAKIELQRAEERPEKTLLARIIALEAEIESQRAEERTEKALLTRIAELEAEIELQRVEIVSSTNAYCLYEVAMESQRVTIGSLEKLCRMYEAEIESLGKSRSSEESPPGKEPETGQQPIHD